MNDSDQLYKSIGVAEGKSVYISFFKKSNLDYSIDNYIKILERIERQINSNIKKKYTEYKAEKNEIKAKLDEITLQKSQFHC